MKPMEIKLIATGILFLLIIASGMWVTRSGRPLNMIIFTAHKLIALACLIMMVLIVRALAKGAAMTPVIIIAIACTAVFFVIMFATGAVLSFEKPAPVFVLLIHKIVPAVTLASSAVTVYLLKGFA
jgi:hypothetical protein